MVSVRDREISREEIWIFKHEIRWQNILWASMENNLMSEQIQNITFVKS